MAHTLLAISGSLRQASTNTTLLQALARVAPEGVTIVFYDGLGELPHFNPDREEEDLPTVAAWRQRLQDADGLLLSTPEYAHGIPGALKNALDWVVGSGELIDKPIALLNPSPMSQFAFAALTEVLTVMTGRIIPEAQVTLPLRGKGLTAEQIATHPEFGPILQASLNAFLQAITTMQEEASETLYPDGDTRRG